MDRNHSFNTLAFEYDGFAYDQVHLISAIKPHPLVRDTQIDLPLERESSQVQFVTQAFFVSRLQKSRTEQTMDFNSGCNDRVS